MKRTITQIGIIYSPYAEKQDCPIQGAFAPESRGRVEVYPAFVKALATIDTFSHIILIYLFDRAGAVELSRPTFLDEEPHGVFASRHPCRPNGIGMSIVRLDSVQGCVLHVSEIDVLDRTPLIDIKPYVPKFDFRADASNGWTDNKDTVTKPPGRE